MIPELAGFITRSEGRKFLKLNHDAAALDLEGQAREGSALYIHIPFCRTLCPFCCFNRYLFDESKARQYFRSLRRELDRYIERGFSFSEFYFGGGTPTIMMDELGAFIEYLRKRFAVRRLSLETTPREINPDNVARLRAAGIDRLSIGVQSFSDSLLKAMGRPFITGEETRRKLAAVQGKFQTVNIDFVFNFPGQSLGQFETDVAIFKEMGIDQATFYPLMASPHKKDAMERRFHHIDTSRERAFYEVILDEVYGAGYQPSTAWCFSRGDRMIDEYIIESDDYIGIGAGSVSMLGGTFMVNSFSLPKYDELVIRGLPVVGWRRLAPGESLRYYLLTHLFGLQVDEDRFRQRFRADINRRLAAELALLRLGGVVEGRGKIRVTRRGMYMVSTMMREFFASLNGLRERYIERQI